MREAAVFCKFLGATGVGNADVWRHDDIRRARVYGWVVVVEGKRGAVVNLPEFDPGGGGVLFEDLDARESIGGAVQPDQRDIIFRRSDAGGVVGRFRVRNVARIGKQSDGSSPVNQLRDVAVWIDGRLAVLGSDHDQGRIVKALGLQFFDPCPY